MSVNRLKPGHFFSPVKMHVTKCTPVEYLYTTAGPRLIFVKCKLATDKQSDFCLNSSPLLPNSNCMFYLLPRWTASCKNGSNYSKSSILHLGSWMAIVYCCYYYDFQGLYGCKTKNAAGALYKTMVWAKVAHCVNCSDCVNAIFFTVADFYNYWCYYSWSSLLVHGQVTIIFVVSVCLFFSAVFDPIWIKLGHVTCPGLVVSRRT